jgi:hypothetical protein
VISETKRANVPLMLMGAVCPRSLSAGRPAAVLHHRLCRRLRQPRHARFHQGDGQGAGADRLRRHGDPALARRNRLCRAAGEDHGHDAGRQGGHSATDRRLHAVRHQAQGRQPELDILLGPVGHPGEDVRSVAPAGLAGHSITWAHIEAEAELARSRTESSTSSGRTRCSRTTWRSTSRSRRRPSRATRDIRHSR